MKILLIAPSTECTNGWGTFANNIESGLLENNHEVSIITQQSGLPAPLSLLKSILMRIKTAWNISRAVKNNKPEIIHILAEPYVLAMPLAKVFGVRTPFVMNFHGTYGVTQVKSKWTKGAMQKALKLCRGFFVCSNFTKTQVETAIKENCNSKILDHVKRNTVFMRLAVKPPEVISKNQSDKHQIVFVGEVKPRKGVLELVNGFVKYKKELDANATLNIVGKFNEKNSYICEMREVIKIYNLKDSVILHGKVSDATLKELYEKADVFAMLSKKDGDNFEGYGLVFIEANGRGIPTISSRESGGAEAVQDGITGYVVDHNNPEHIAEKLSGILLEKKIDPEECIKWAKQHNIAQQTKTCERLYEKIIC